MMTQSSSPVDGRIPVSLLTGFLGSGKTTLLNTWLRDPAMADAAVIVNEFGEVGIDHDLIASSNDNTIELSTGCLCCTVRGDLVETLRELYVKRERGEIPRFSRVLVETTGLADPVPVIQALITFPVARAYVLGRVITVVDAVNGGHTLHAHPEALRQVVVADELVLSKNDLADSGALAEQVGRLNPGAGLTLSSTGAPPSAKLLDGVNIYDPTTRPAAVAEWLNADRYGGLVEAEALEQGHAHNGESTTHRHEGHDHGHDSHGKHDASRHSHDIGSFCLSYREPLHWEHVCAWLDALVLAHGDQLLRVKGIINVAGRERPVVVQAVQRLFHPPAALSDWPKGSTDSRIVFITRGLSREFVSEVFDTLRLRQPIHS